MARRGRKTLGASEGCKRCVKCLWEWPPEWFHSSKNTYDGRHPYCKFCRTSAQTQKSTVDGSLVRSKARNAVLRRTGAMWCAICGHAYPPNSSRSGTCGPCNRATTAAWLSVPENKQRQRQWQSDNQAKMKEYVRRWQRKNPDVVSARSHVMRAKAYGVEYELVLRSDVWERDGGMCGICGLEADSENWHLDHIKPLSRGGPHLMSNVQVAHPRCNLRKHASEDFVRVLPPTVPNEEYIVLDL